MLAAKRNQVEDFARGTGMRQDQFVYVLTAEQADHVDGGDGIGSRGNLAHWARGWNFLSGTQEADHLA